MSEQSTAAAGPEAQHAEAVATVEHGAPAHPQPVAFGFLTAPMFIGLAMIVVIALMIWKKVPAAIGRALDSKIAVIRDQLAEAETLREEAEALKAEYEKKAKAIDKDRKALMERAQHEADEIVAKAKRDAEALIERRTRMAEDKIAAEERAAVDQLRATAADAAARAAARLIAERHDPATDEQIVNRAIGEIAAR